MNISDLNKYTLIEHLWENAKPASFFFFNPSVRPPGKPTKQEIDQQTQYGGYIDYLNGRCIKTSFEDMTKVDPKNYDRDYGAGAFESVVQKLRKMNHTLEL